MSKQITEQETHAVFVRYRLKTETYAGFVVTWLYCLEKGTNSKGNPRRDWWNTPKAEDAFDFAPEYDSVQKAVSYAQRLGKIVKVGKQLMAQGYELEVVLRTRKQVIETTERDVIINDPTNPLVQLAVASL